MSLKKKPTVQRTLKGYFTGIELSIWIYIHIDKYVNGAYHWIMVVNIHIPKESFFTLYAKGKIEGKHTVDDLGTFISFDGVVILFYKYPHHRRAYIIRNDKELTNFPLMTLPNVKQKIGIIYRALGRQIDQLRWVYWNLEKINGKQVYCFPTSFWQKVSCLIDTTTRTGSAAIRSNLEQLSSLYNREI